MSIIKAAKAFFSVASAIEPHIVKIIDYHKALSAAETEKQRLKEENESLKTQIVIAAALAIAFFVSSIVLLVFVLSK
ncbi:MAG: hypothetical protein LBO62_03320 [Endomicrobium sp.]|nr:hypothetical protein [Endomicrobium sp.]